MSHHHHGHHHDEPIDPVNPIERPDRICKIDDDYSITPAWIWFLVLIVAAVALLIFAGVGAHQGLHGRPQETVVPPVIVASRPAEKDQSTPAVEPAPAPSPIVDAPAPMSQIAETKPAADEAPRAHDRVGHSISRPHHHHRHHRRHLARHGHGHKYVSRFLRAAARLAGAIR
jgi:hypothetical protein